MVCLEYTYFFYKQPAYKQLALGWQIAKQLSALNLFSLSNNKNYRLKKSGVFSSIVTGGTSTLFLFLSTNLNNYKQLKASKSK